MKKTMILLLSTLLVSSCSKVDYSNSQFNSSNESSNSSKESTHSSINTSTITYSSREGENEVIVNGKKDIDQDAFYNEFYDYKSDIEINLKFKNESIYKLAKYSSDEYKKDMYHPCDMVIYMNGTNYVFIAPNQFLNPGLNESPSNFGGLIISGSDDTNGPSAYVGMSIDNKKKLLNETEVQNVVNNAIKGVRGGTNVTIEALVKAINTMNNKVALNSAETVNLTTEVENVVDALTWGEIK
jgi:hypothetical protein